MAEKSRDPKTGRFLNQGGFGPPPPGAPREVSSPLSISEADIEAARARALARVEERLAGAEGGGRAEGQTSLSSAPRVAGSTDRENMAGLGPDAEGCAEAQGGGGADRLTLPMEQPADAEGNGQPARPDGPSGPSLGTERAGRSGHAPVRPAPTILGQAPQPEPEPVEPSALDDLTDAFKATHPAASTTDSPSRGIPQPVGDPGKQITGGWGPQGSGSEYFALDGSELKAIVLALAARLQQALDGDLRFGLSVVYPQVKVSLSLTVDGRSPEGRDLDLPGNEKIDLNWSRILALRAEVEDNEDSPAGKIRDDFQIRGPQKQVIRAGAARLLVDVPNEREA